MPTIDDLKKQRDGHLSFGKVHPDDPSTWMWPVVTAIGYDADGRQVSHLKAFSHESGEMEYGAPGAVRYEPTEAGKRLGYWR